VSEIARPAIKLLLTTVLVPVPLKMCLPILLKLQAWGFGSRPTSSKVAYLLTRLLVLLM
jgi:hypothetical protein